MPECQRRALWAGFTTCYVELRISKIVMVETGLLEVFKKPAGPAQEECCLK